MAGAASPGPPDEVPGVLRGYGLQVITAVQTASHLYEIYGRDESVRGNLGYLLVFPATDQRTAEEISKLLGERTLYVETRGRSTGTTLFAARRITNERDQRRALLTPDEVRRLGDDHPILLTTDAHPILNQMSGYFRHRHLARRTRIPPPLPARDGGPDARHWLGHRAVVPPIEGEAVGAGFARGGPAFRTGRAL